MKENLRKVNFLFTHRDDPGYSCAMKCRKGFTLIEMLACQPKPWRRQSKSGFTLIEMLVVIAIIALLASLLVPAVSGALNSAKTIGSINNLRNIHQMFTMYLLDNNQQFMFNVHGSGQDHDWPRVLWEDVHGEFEGDVVEAMEASGYARTMWCPVQVSNHGQEQHPWGRTSYGMNRFFRPTGWGGGIRYLDDPLNPGSLEPLLMAGTPHPANAAYGTYPMNLSANYPYDTAWENVSYAYGSNKKNAVALWIAGNARVLPRENMIALHSDLSNASDFK